MKRKKVVVIGGGTGSFTVLSALKKYPLELSAVVSMADDGGSTGMLRDELGVLPPGDIRQCLVALSQSDRLMRKLMNYRFRQGRLIGHNFGNILLSALEKVTGSFDSAVEKASEILQLQGRVIPATLTKVELVAYLKNGMVLRGQSRVDSYDMSNLKKLVLEPRAKANPKAIKAIYEADAIIIGPGNFYSSLVPNFLIKGTAHAVARSRAEKIYLCNLMNRAGQTDGFLVRDFVKRIEDYIGKVDCVVYNTKNPAKDLLKRYVRDGDSFVKPMSQPFSKRFIGVDLLGRHIVRKQKGDLIERSFIRHDPEKLARALIAIMLQ